MKLINLNTGEVFLSQNPGEALIFTDPSLNQAMSEFGIIIPEALQHAYGYKKRVYREDPEFLDAFKTFFFEREMEPKNYTWH